MSGLRQIAFYSIGGKPFIMYMGIFTLLCLLFTASIAILNHRGMHKIPFKWHPKMAGFTIAVAFLHGLLGLSLFFK